MTNDTFPKNCTSKDLNYPFNAVIKNQSSIRLKINVKTLSQFFEKPNVTIFTTLTLIVTMCVCVCHRIEHLSLNMAMQLLVGVPLEMVHGALRIGLVYVCGVLAGGRCVISPLALHPSGTKHSRFCSAVVPSACFMFLCI